MGGWWLAALALQAAPATAVDAERAFADAARTQGQWTAFRRFAAADAIMFLPQPTNVQSFFKDMRDPPVAVRWWAARSHVSCDGRYAVNTGPTLWPDGRPGYFTTVWRREPDGSWRWIIDHGDFLPHPVAAGDRPRVTRASCRPGAPGLPTAGPGAGEAISGTAPDATLAWAWHIAPDGGRALDVYAWNGRQMAHVVADRVEAAR